MNTSPDAAAAHARALNARRPHWPPGSHPPGDIIDSWLRCMDAGLDEHAALTVPVVDAGDLAQRRERADFLRRLARAELETLTQQIAGSNFLLAFGDPEGVILDLYADNRFTMSGSDAPIRAGSCWSERLCGTNGLGTALVAGTSVAVTGPEHYFRQLGGISCTATPIRDARDDIVGVLDASSYVESRQRHTQALVQMAARHMENALLIHQMRAQLVLAVHPRPEFLGTLSAGLLALDGEGRLLAVNARGRQILSGLDARPGAGFDELFGEPFALVRARLHRNDEVMLRDAMGSLLVARCLGRPCDGPLVAAREKSPAPATAPRPVAAAASAQTTGDRASFVAEDPAVATACEWVERAVRRRMPVLIQGETGTGKELLARHAHAASGRAGPFVAVNCAALPGELFEAELFGYAPGAFTGARRDGHAGLIASADGGTLLLDEVGELPMPLQAALLRFLDDQLVRPVGGSAGRRVDVQLLAASNADLEAEVAARRFRADLLYRLDTVRVSLPPLRERRDFEAAARRVLFDLDPAASLGADAVERLARRPWPGNFRELRAVLARALLTAPDAHLDARSFEDVPDGEGDAPASQLQKNATELVRREFERAGRSVSRTARCLGVSRTTVYRHLGDARTRTKR